MNGALGAWRDGVAEQLREAGLNAVTAMDGAAVPRWREAVAAVSLSRVVCASGGFQDYLGLRTGADGEEREVYGREAELTLTLDIFAPRDRGGDACRRLAEAAVEVLICRGAAGLAALEVRTGPVEFLEREGMYRQEVTCRCGAWLTAVSVDGGGVFTDFVVKGRMR